MTSREFESGMQGVFIKKARMELRDRLASMVPGTSTDKVEFAIYAIEELMRAIIDDRETELSFRE
jgi:hypothetical protein